MGSKPPSSPAAAHRRAGTDRTRRLARRAGFLAGLVGLTVLLMAWRQARLLNGPVHVRLTDPVTLVTAYDAPPLRLPSERRVVLRFWQRGRACMDSVAFEEAIGMPEVFSTHGEERPILVAHMLRLGFEGFCTERWRGHQLYQWRPELDRLLPPERVHEDTTILVEPDGAVRWVSALDNPTPVDRILGRVARVLHDLAGGRH